MDDGGPFMIYLQPLSPGSSQLACINHGRSSPSTDDGDPFLLATSLARIRDDGYRPCPRDESPPRIYIPTSPPNHPRPIVYEIVVPQGCPVPTWLQPHVQMFMSDGLNQLRPWVDALSLWLLYESRGGYVEVEGHPGTADKRTQDLVTWVSMSRDPLWRPQTTQYDSEDLHDELRIFWESIWPPWFSALSYRSPEGGHWVDWQLVGKSGFLDIFASFFFAGRVGCSECEMPGPEAMAELDFPWEWYCRVDDLTQILSRLVHGHTYTESFI